MELVSVILPAHNAALFVAEAIESVLAQTYENLEFLVVDDGSDDGTENIVSGYKTVHYIRQQNSGAGSARNRGIRAAKGDFISFIDADDLWLPQNIELQVDYLRRSEYAWCYCDSYFSWFDSGKIIGKLSSTQGVYQNDILLPYISGKFSIPLPSTLIRREVFEDVGYFDESLKTMEHTDLWARIALKYPIGYIDQPLVQIRKRLDSLKRTTDPLVTGRNRRQMIEKLIAKAPDRLQGMEKGLLTISFILEGKHLLRYGRMSEARKCFGKAIQLSPTSIRPYFFWLACRFEMVPRLFYKIRWNLLSKRKANIQPGWWVEQE